jgi:hypothetical protein
LNVQDIVTRVKRTFGDEAGVQITNTDILRWINDAQEEIVANNNLILETTAISNVVANQIDYNMPPNLNTLKNLYIENLKLDYLSKNEFNEYLNRYAAKGTTKSKNPTHFTMWGGKISVFPIPDIDIEDGLKIEYTRHPVPVEQIIDELDVPRQYHSAITDYCLAQAYELDEDIDKASYKGTQFGDKLTRRRNSPELSSQEFYPTITVREDDL